MKAFDPNHKLLDEMYQDDYYPAFLVDKVKDELQKVIEDVYKRQVLLRFRPRRPGWVQGADYGPAVP